MKSIIEMSDKQIKGLVKLRCANDTLTKDNPITQIKILMKHKLAVSVNVYTKKYSAESYGIALYNKMYANEFLYLQSIGFDLTFLNKERL